MLGTLVGLLPRGRGRDRALYAAVFAVGVAWAVHAGVDWDWQMPVISLPFAALGGLALGRPPWRGGGAGAGVSASLRAFLAGAAVIGVCVLPALVLASQVRLDSATTAYSAADCASADRLAARAVEILGTRAGPWQIEALCAVRANRFGAAERLFAKGLAEDPNDWQLQAGLAAARAAIGLGASAQAATRAAPEPARPGRAGARERARPWALEARTPSRGGLLLGAVAGGVRLMGGIGSDDFERLYDQHAERLLGFLAYHTGDRALAEDIVADTFERVLRTRSGYRGRSGEKTWLYAIAMNRLRDLARRSGAEARAVERVVFDQQATVPIAGEDYGVVADRDLLHRALQTLPEDERAVVALRFGGDLSLSEIAELLDERQTTIEGRLYRGLRRLRDVAS